METKEKKKTRMGRPPGSPNKSTSNAREAIARFVDGNAERLQEWLDQIAEDPKHGPLAAFKCLTDVMEYHVPKLQRTEHTGNGADGAIRIEFPWLTKTLDDRNN